VHDVEKEITFPSNDRLVVHDSEGFEAGDEDKLKTVLTFVKARSREECSIADRLHAIW
jgi:hypothetical protein